MRPQQFTLAPGLLGLMTSASATEVSAGLPSGTFVQAMFGLLIIVALLAGTAWFARKLTGGQNFGRGGMRVVGGVALGPRERMVLVEVGENWLVVGIVPGQIRTLHVLPKGEMPEDSGSAAEKPFALWLKNVVERRGNAS
ncbi:MAG: flagellar biosynthetic protein FliO [Betaproteobacteria bacterium]